MLFRSQQFVFGGKSLFTVRNEETGNRFTFKVRAFKKADKEMYFVSVLNGQDNDSSYSYIGTAFGKTSFSRTSKSKVSADAQSFKVFNYLVNAMANNTLSEKVNIYHEGKCARCGRTLTVPESIESGFGPECAKRM